MGDDRPAGRGRGDGRGGGRVRPLPLPAVPQRSYRSEALMSRGDIHDLVTSIDGLGFEVERLVEIHRAMAIDHLGRDPVGHLYEDDDVVPDQDHDPQPPAWVTGSEARGDEP